MPYIRFNPGISFSKKLFFFVMLFALIFVTSFIIYQYQREKDYKRELLNTKLQDYNDRLYDEFVNVSYNKDVLKTNIHSYANKRRIDSLRITIIDTDGEVIYDNEKEDFSRMDNHLKRVEVQQAILDGTGYDIHRKSASTGISYFYSAKYYENKFIIRTALPYDVSLINSLKIDSHFLWFTLLLTLILGVFFYQYTRKLGMSISRLKEFTQLAEDNGIIDAELLTSFPKSELGDISMHIVDIYRRLYKTKEELSIEKEKLIAHLQTSREGVGIFSSDKREILVNRLFIQYANLISDNNLEKTEEVFTIEEFKPLINFIDDNMLNALGKSEKRMSINIHKNGKSFIAEVIVFQDFSFELLISDVTQEQEQVDLKKQLTQNAAHELKTPVSSIQGYLETIVNNKDLSEEKRKIFLERCYAQSYRLSRLLRDISVLTRMDEASNMIDMERVDISAIMKTILNEVNLELEQKEIYVINQLNRELIIKGNVSLLYSIFRNLTDNAIAYAGTGITITIKCFREDENFFYFSFADNGVGIGPEHLNRLFERFYRIDKGRSRKLGGTGLGLSIVKNAVMIHGGSISAKNNHNGGLEFVFTLAKG